jgi:hypothetical protein
MTSQPENSFPTTAPRLQLQKHTGNALEDHWTDAYS